MRKTLFALSLLLLVACSAGNDIESASLEAKPGTGRWYTVEQRDAGLALFRRHCAQCHGENAEGTADWKTPDADGSYPPPPLNGSAHAWHHPLAMLHKVIAEGGAPYGGRMLAWQGELTEAEMLKVIAGFQSFWPDAIYQRWLEIEKRSRAP
ncbi:c-type cytochrome [Marinobacterium arenosum]|uniref:c-type cytochrome n=1 Tax=Marinobacterium arenosum TaxID=2862496 RepID=UPI001C97D24F|nr:cytochrome c [Marinobacterium arenosum]MBY4677572.1 cytochrome c [Marinobacterium arenosum]